MKKIVKIILLFCLFFFPFTVFASTNTKVRTEEDYLVSDWVEVTEENRDDILNTPAVDASEKIYDFADLLSPFEEEQIYALVSEYIRSYQMDLAIVTIHQNNKGSQADYADDFYDYNSFGLGDNRDGLLFLVDMEYRQIYISTTGSAISMYNDVRIEQILDQISSYFTHEEYAEGIKQLIQILSNHADMGLPNKKTKITTFQTVLYASIISLVLTAIVMGILIHKNRLAKVATTAEEYLQQDSVVVQSLGDVFLGSNTEKHSIARNTTGGSSTHHSSSGSSHGGGGHGF